MEASNTNINKLGKPKAALSWSGGKDSTLALYRSLNRNELSIEFLFTTLNADSRDMNIHGISQELLLSQAKAIGLPLRFVPVHDTGNTGYEYALKKELAFMRSQGISQIIFGDIFLEDLRLYREKLLEPFGIEAVFPLWKNGSTDLLEEFFNAGFSALCCASEIPSLTGRLLSPGFIEMLPTGADPCGENGEYHCFCFDGPIFSYPLHIDAGQPFGIIQKLSDTSSYRFYQAPITEIIPGL